MRKVIIESPYAGDTYGNTQYLKRCLRDSIDRGEAPIASHLIYPFVLREDLKDQRNLGIQLGFEWWSAADRICFYIDKGYSSGMLAAQERATRLGIPWEERELVTTPGRFLLYSNGRLGWLRRLWNRWAIPEKQLPARQGAKHSSENSQRSWRPSRDDGAFINSTLARDAPLPFPCGEPEQS